MGLVYCLWDSQTSFFTQTFIKNGSHNTIHIFKNYFTTVFSIFNKISGIQTYPKRFLHLFFFFFPNLTLLLLTFYFILSFIHLSKNTFLSLIYLFEKINLNYGKASTECFNALDNVRQKKDEDLLQTMSFCITKQLMN